MIILGLFWFSWVVFLFSLKKSPELQHYLRFSDVQATKSLTFSLMFIGLSCLSLFAATTVGLTPYLECIALVLTVLGLLSALKLVIKD